MLQNRKSDPARLAGDIMRWLDRPLVLVGLMGVGKSTVGKRLANDLGIGFVDAGADHGLAMRRRPTRTCRSPVWLPCLLQMM